MANENENIKKNDGKDKDENWLEHIEDEVEGNIENLDTDFPLSGGEEPMTALDEEDEEDTDDDKKEKKSSFRKDLNTEFPLSGGEVDR